MIITMVMILCLLVTRWSDSTCVINHANVLPLSRTPEDEFCFIFCRAYLDNHNDWLFVCQVGEFKAHAAEWKANVRAELRETRRRLSVELHDKLQRAATIRSMERRQLGLEQRAQSLDMLSPEKRAIFSSFDRGHFTTSSQESIDTKLSNLRMKAEICNKHTASEENIFNRFGSLSKLAKRNRNKDMPPNIAEDAMRLSSNSSNNTLAEERQEAHKEEEVTEKENNTMLTNLSQYTEQHVQLNGFVPAQAKERETEKMLVEREHQP